MRNERAYVWELLSLCNFTFNSFFPRKSPSHPQRGWVIILVLVKIFIRGDARRTALLVLKHLRQLNFGTARRFAGACVRALCVFGLCCCAWTFSNRMDTVLEFLDGAVGCGLLSSSRSRIVDHKVDIEVSCLKCLKRVSEIEWNCSGGKSKSIK